LINGILYDFKKQTSDDANVMFNAFGIMVNVMGQKVKPYLLQINDEVVAQQHNLLKKFKNMSKLTCN
jgi:hypothetical protein